MRERKVFNLVVWIVLLLPITVKAKEYSVERLSGDNRTETSIEVSKRVYGDEGKTEGVVLVGYKGEADALAGTLLSSVKDVPILIVNEVDGKVKGELERLGVKKVYLLGGSSILSKEVEEEIEREGYRVERIGGKDRVETAVGVLRESGVGAEHVYLVNDGRSGSLVDALTIGPVSGRDKKPILLTSKTKLPKVTRDILKEKGTNKVTIIGGTAVVGEGVELELMSKGIEVDRIAGTNRYNTAIKVADESFGGTSRVVVVNDGGEGFSDALVSGYLGAKEGSPILVTGKKDLTRDIENYIRRGVTKVDIVGGKSVVGGSVKEKIRSIIKEESDKVGKEEEVRRRNIKNREQLREIMGEDMVKRPDQLKYIYRGEISLIHQKR